LISFYCVFELFAEIVHDFLESFEEGNLIFLLEGQVERIYEFHLSEDFIFERSKFINLFVRMGVIFRLYFCDEGAGCLVHFVIFILFGLFIIQSLNANIFIRIEIIIPDQTTTKNMKVHKLSENVGSISRLNSVIFEK
jgi:hypothetical protein